MKKSLGKQKLRCFSRATGSQLVTGTQRVHFQARVAACTPSWQQGRSLHRPLHTTKKCWCAGAYNPPRKD